MKAKTTILSDPIDIRFFRTQAEKPGFSLVDYFWAEAKHPPKTVYPEISFCQLDDRFNIVFAHRELELYLLDENQERTELVYTQCEYLYFDEPVDHVCSNHLYPQAVTLVVVALRSQLLLYRLDHKQRKLILDSNYWISDINAISFLGPFALFAVSGCRQFWEFDCASHELSKKVNLEVQMHSEKDLGYFLKGSLFKGPSTFSEDYIIIFLYVTSHKVHSVNTQTFIIKQFLRSTTWTTEGSLYPLKERDVKKSTSLSKANMYSHRGSLIIVLEDQMIMIRKVYQEYLLIDNIRRRSDDIHITYCEDGMVFLRSEKLVEMRKMVLSETACSLECVNILECQLPLDFGLFYVQNRSNNYLFYFSDPANRALQKVGFLVREEPMKKLLALAKTQANPQQVWTLGNKFGISKKEFFQQQWLQSPKVLSDIFTFLFQTDDIATIKRELKLSFRRSSFQLNEIINIYHKLQVLIEQKLTRELSTSLVKEYLKCHFLLRKFKIQPEGVIQFGGFLQVRRKGVIKYLQELYGHYRKMSQMNTREKEKAVKTVKPDIVMKNIIGEFQLILLENYEQDLIQLIRPFSLDLRYFFDKFPFFLPNHPFKLEVKPKINMSPQKCVSNQSKLFLPIRETDLDEELSLQFLRRQLEKHHPSSKVREVLEELIHDSQFLSKRMVTHGLIISPKAQFIQKVTKIQGVNLFLIVCEFNNVMNFENKEDYVDLTDIFEAKNGLRGLDLQRVRFYSELHWLILKEDVTRQLDIVELYSLKDEDLIALFFLGNKEKKTLVLKQLRDLYQRYFDKQQNQFNVSISKFVRSDVCSPVEVRQLMNEVMFKGHSFQQQNQEFINIIVDGYCFRTQIREIMKIAEMKYILMQVKMDQALNERVLRVLTISGMRPLFETFGCEMLTILHVESEGTDILNTILQNYFKNPNISREQFFIDSFQISLVNPRNMLNVLLYVQEKLYPDIQEADVLILFGNTLIQYELFDTLQDLFHQRDVFDTLDINNDEYAEALIKKALGDIYRNPQLGTFQELKPHILKILGLRILESRFIVQEEARLRLGEIVTDCNFQITPYQLFEIDNKDDFVMELIQEGYQYLTWDKLFQINECFKVINNSQIQEKDTDFLTWVALYAKLLVRYHFVQQVQSSICYLLHSNCYYQLYNIVTEAMLQAVTKKYPVDSVISRQIIEFYVLSYQSLETIAVMFETNFSRESILDYNNKSQLLEVDQTYFYLRLQSTYVRLDLLQQMVKNITKDAHEFHRYYYFVIAVLSAPTRAFNLQDFEYDFRILQELVDQIGTKLLRKQEHSKVGSTFNYFRMRKNFLIGLVKHAAYVLDEKEIDQSCLDNLANNMTLDSLFYLLKEKDKNELMGVIKRCFTYLQQNEKTNKTKLSKAHNYTLTIQKDIEDNSMKKRPSAPKKQSVNRKSKSFYENRLNKTLTLQQFMNDFQNLSTYHQNLNQKQIIGMIWDTDNLTREEELKRFSLDLVPIDREGNLDLTQQGIIGTENYYMTMFDECRQVQIRALSHQSLMQNLKEYYNKVSITKFVKLMETILVVDYRNIKMAQSALRIVSDFDLKQLFTFDFFFFTPNIYHDQSNNSNKCYYEEVFQYLLPTIKRIVDENNWYISKIICAFLKFDKTYEYKVIVLALEKTLIKSYEDSDEFYKVIQPMLLRLPLKSLAANFFDLIGICKACQTKRMFLQLLLSIFESQEGTNRLTPEEVENIQDVKLRIKAMLEYDQ